MYQFSLDFFYEIFETVLHNNANLTGITEPAKRLQILTADLYVEAFRRTARGILNEDRLVLALIFSQIKCRTLNSSLDFDSLFGLDHIIPSNTISNFPPDLFSDDQERGILQLATSSHFQNITKHITENVVNWKEFIHSDNYCELPEGAFIKKGNGDFLSYLYFRYY